MRNFPFDENKAVATVLFILQERGKIGRHELFKILYFADQKHLAQYGRPVIGDRYIAMKNGPVPSKIYDAIKSVAEPSSMYSFELFDSAIKTSNIFIEAKLGPDMDELSKSDITCLLESIKENSGLSFHQLTDKSHGLAWQKACTNNDISVKLMAREAGADIEMEAYIKEKLEDIRLAQA
ncbi:MAG: SocA family protein [Labilibaculum sp.]|nr:Panacea domain-containing protein [Labilibaculum sp.]MBI9056824.1 SocA family protein [Labilibaculum sp.]